jgi:hypothetical protein
MESLWQNRFTQGISSGLNEENAKLYANACIKLRKRRAELESSRATSIFLAEPPPQRTAAPVPKSAKCKAKCLNGKPCQFKAVCTGFCMKHLPNKNLSIV